MRHLFFLIIPVIFSSVSDISYGQLLESPVHKEHTFIPKKKLLSIDLKKTGTYFGYSRGRIDGFEFGVSHQRKKLKLIHPKTHQYHLGVSYNFKHNIMGYEAGYWYRGGRFQLTYGANMVVYTDFDRVRVGLGPVIGYKLLGFHLQTGYHWLNRDDAYLISNNFFIRLRFTIINDVDVDLGRRKKKKKK